MASSSIERQRPPAPAEGWLAHGQVTGGGRSVRFGEGELRGTTQRTVARAMGTFWLGLLGC